MFTILAIRLGRLENVFIVNFLNPSTFISLLNSVRNLKTSRKAGDMTSVQPIIIEQTQI